MPEAESGSLRADACGGCGGSRGDFILANQGYQYLETEAEKIAYFYDQLHIEKVYLPVKLYMGGAGSHPTLRYFVDKFPLFLSAPRPGFSPVVTFSFIDPGLEALTGFLTHLGQYQTLFRELADFRFLYISGTPAHFEKATQLFNSQVKVPLESDIAGDLIRYFRARSIWSSSEFKTLSKAELLFLDGAKRRFAGDRLETLFKTWKAGRIGEAELRAALGIASRHVAEKPNRRSRSVSVSGITASTAHWR